MINEDRPKFIYRRRGRRRKEKYYNSTYTHNTRLLFNDNNIDNGELRPSVRDRRTRSRAEVPNENNKKEDNNQSNRNYPFENTLNCSKLVCL